MPIEQKSCNTTGKPYFAIPRTTRHPFSRPFPSPAFFATSTALFPPVLFLVLSFSFSRPFLLPLSCTATTPSLNFSSLSPLKKKAAETPTIGITEPCQRASALLCSAWRQRWFRLIIFRINISFVCPSVWLGRWLAGWLATYGLQAGGVALLKVFIHGSLSSPFHSVS